MERGGPPTPLLLLGTSAALCYSISEKATPDPLVQIFFFFDLPLGKKRGGERGEAIAHTQKNWLEGHMVGKREEEERRRRRGGGEEEEEE